MSSVRQVRQLLRDQEVSDVSDPGPVGGAASRAVLLHRAAQHPPYYGPRGRRPYCGGPGRTSGLTLRLARLLAAAAGRPWRQATDWLT